MTLRVVVADDDSDIRGLVRIAVVRARLDLVADVDNGSAALDAIVRFSPELAILDVAMPGLSGLAVTRAVRGRPQLAGTRILLLSAAVDDASRATGFAAGADDYLAKPFSPRQLVAWLRASTLGVPPLEAPATLAASTLGAPTEART